MLEPRISVRVESACLTPNLVAPFPVGVADAEEADVALLEVFADTEGAGKASETLGDATLQNS